MQWLNDTYGYFGGFVTDQFNLQQFVPGLSDDLAAGLGTMAEVASVKGIATKGVGAAGAAMTNVASTSAGRRLGYGLVTWGKLSSGVGEVFGALTAPFATAALMLAREHCQDPLTGKRCE